MMTRGARITDVSIRRHRPACRGDNKLATAAVALGVPIWNGENYGYLRFEIYDIGIKRDSDGNDFISMPKYYSVDGAIQDALRPCGGQGMGLYQESNNGGVGAYAGWRRAIAGFRLLSCWQVAGVTKNRHPDGGRRGG